jgi:hypothetical protein
MASKKMKGYKKAVQERKGATTKEPLRVYPSHDPGDPGRFQAYVVLPEGFSVVPGPSDSIPPRLYEKMTAPERRRCLDKLSRDRSRYYARKAIEERRKVRALVIPEN